MTIVVFLFLSLLFIYLISPSLLVREPDVCVCLQTVADFEQMTPALEAKLAKIELILDEPVEFETGDKKEHHAATKKNDVSFQ